MCKCILSPQFCFLEVYDSMVQLIIMQSFVYADMQRAVRIVLT